MVRFLLIPCLVALLFLSGCSGGGGSLVSQSASSLSPSSGQDEQSAVGSGAMRITLKWSEAGLSKTGGKIRPKIPGGTNSIRLAISGENLNSPVVRFYNNPQAGGTISDTISLPAGNKTAEVTAVDGTDGQGNILAHRKTSFSVVVGQTTTIALNLGVTITNNGFVPQHMELLPGDTVLWINDTGNSQSFTIDGASSGTILPGGSWSHTFAAAGIFSYQGTPFPGDMAVLAPVQVFSVNPGSASIGDPVTITGKNFGATRNAFGTNGNVIIGGATAQDANYVSWSDTQIVVKVPGGATTGPVSVSVGPQTASAGNLTILPILITSLNPQRGNAGDPVTITGGHFGATRNAFGSNGNVTFGGVQAMDADFISWTDAQIVVNVPAGAPSGNVVVSTGGQMATRPFGKARIAFASNGDGDYEIFVMDVDGSNQTQLTFNGSWDRYPSWSPDGSKIAFASNRDGTWEVYSMNADGSNQTRLTVNGLGAYWSLAWSPDGTRITFQQNISGNEDVSVMNADGSNQTRLTTAGSLDAYPSWSPDSSKIAFVSQRDGNWEIYSMNADGSSQTRLTNVALNDAWPSWSPDGMKIIFYSFRDGNPEVYVMDANGGNQTNVTNNAASDTSPSWSAGGTKFVFVSNRYGGNEICVSNSDGSSVVRLTNNISDDVDPSWFR
ncbi:MAG: PD40 domain-containing protein [Armatimonadetes bacterium]|nr:PD40 domain-containing protein [Armatimonadota bacterium]